MSQYARMFFVCALALFFLPKYEYGQKNIAEREPFYPTSASYEVTKKLVSLMQITNAPMCDEDSCRYVLEGVTYSYDTALHVPIPASIQTVLFEDKVNVGVVHLAVVSSFFDSTLHQEVRVTVIDYLADGVVDLYLEQIDQFQKLESAGMLAHACFMSRAVDQCTITHLKESPSFNKTIYVDFIESITHALEKKLAGA